MLDDMPSADAASHGATLPTRAEFGRRLAVDHRRFYWAIGLCCAGLLLLFVGMAFNAERMNRAGVPPGAAGRFTAGDGILCFIPLAILFGGPWWADRRSQTKCPACRQSLFTAHDPYVAMVTGRCPKCAAPMFADDVRDLDAQQTNHRTPFMASGALQEIGGLARQSRPAIPWAIAGTVWQGLGFKAKDLLETQYYSALLGEVWTEFLKRMWFVPGVFVGSLGLWASGRALGKNAKPCSACGNMIGGWERKTGNCTSCGLPVIDDPFPGPQPRDAVASRLWTIDEYRTSAKLRYGRLWIGCFIRSGLALVWCTPMPVYLSQRPRYFTQTGWELVGTVVTFVGLGVMQWLGCWWWDRRLARGLRCPDCDHNLLHFYPLDVSSQRCCHCGCQVLETPVVQAAT